MNTWARLSLLFIMSACSTGFAASSDIVEKKLHDQKLSFIFDSTPIANLTFHLDCLANLIHCDENAISPIWKTTDWTPADDAALKKWDDIQRRYSGLEYSLPEIEKEKLREIGYPLRHRGVTFEQKFRIIGLSAESIADYRRSLGFLMRPEDVDQVVSIVEHFHPRFMKWWKQTGRSMTDQFVKDFTELMKSKDLLPLLKKSTIFYRSELSPSSEIYIHFIPMVAKSGHTSGEQIENHGVVEFLPSEKPEDRIDVICHEIFHYFYSAASAKNHIELVSFFLNSNAPYAIPAYNLLNESLATAFGNGMVARATHSSDWFKKVLTKDRSFYNDHAIDAVAKQILPLLDAGLENQKTLYDPGFLNSYLEAVQSALPQQGSAPQLVLRTSATFYEKEFKANYRNFQRKTHTGNTWDSTEIDSDLVQSKLNEAKHLSGLLILRSQSLNLLDQWRKIIPNKTIAEIRRLGLKNKPFIYSVPRSNNSWLFVVVANPGEETAALLEKLAEAPRPFTGTFF